MERHTIFLDKRVNIMSMSMSLNYSIKVTWPLQKITSRIFIETRQLNPKEHTEKKKNKEQARIASKNSRKE